MRFTKIWLWLFLIGTLLTPLHTLADEHDSASCEVCIIASDTHALSPEPSTITFTLQTAQSSFFHVVESHHIIVTSTVLLRAPPQFS